MNAEPGDLVVCVDDGLNSIGLLPNVRRGKAYRFIRYTRKDKNGELCCLVEGAQPHDDKLGFLARRFRKIRPDEPEACEEEFQVLLERSKRRVEA